MMVHLKWRLAKCLGERPSASLPLSANRQLTLNNETDVSVLNPFKNLLKYFCLNINIG